MPQGYDGMPHGYGQTVRGLTLNGDFSQNQTINPAPMPANRLQGLDNGKPNADIENILDGLKHDGNDNKPDNGKMNDPNNKPDNDNKPDNNGPSPPPSVAASPYLSTDDQSQAKVDMQTLLDGPKQDHDHMKSGEYADHALKPGESYSKQDLEDKLKNTDDVGPQNAWRTSINKLTADNGEGSVFDSLKGPDGKVSYEALENYSKSQVNGADGQINGDTKQQGEGDCRFLSTTRAFGQTDEGRAYLKQAIKSNDDGSYDVKFAGADKSYHVSKEDAEKGNFAKGDEDMQVVGCAADQYFKDNGKQNGIDNGGGDFMKLYTGKDDSDTSKDYHGIKFSEEDMKNALYDAAPDLGKTKGAIVSGGVGNNGDWKGEGVCHEFQIESVDKQSGTVTYTNPWDTSVKHTIKVDDFVKQIHDNEETGLSIVDFKN